MSDSIDLRGLLKSWPYDPEHEARLARGADGRDILQVRTPLGVEQYEMDGRPDGLRPHGMESALEYHLRRLSTAKAAGRESDFELGAADCEELFSEGVIYYYRYLRLFQLKDWSRTVRDTARNLRVFDLVHRHAAREEDRIYLEKWRPYIIRINACAAAMTELEKQAHPKALAIVQSAIEGIESLEELDEETFAFERQRSLQELHELAGQIEKLKPPSEVELLERQLRRAVDRQEFERAAKLRDRLLEIKARPAT